MQSLETAHLADRWPQSLIRLVDVGGAGGLQEKWLARPDLILPVMFEPNPEEALKLQHSLSGKFSEVLIIESGLANQVGPRDLHITQYWGCSSLRKPDREILSNYRIGRLFDVVKIVSVECTRYDHLFAQGRVPSPDVIKIDVQGFEYEVLLGFGGLLQDCLAIEIEAHFYRIYEGQKLLHELVDFLRAFDFVLRKLSPGSSFDGDLVEVDAQFTKNRRAWMQLPSLQKDKFSVLCQTWDLIDYSNINPTAHHNDFTPTTL